jgi:PAS domain S-box-containing protein
LALASLEERFRLFVESVGEYAIFMLDPQGYISSWNVGAERIKGYSEEEILGKHFSIFYTESARQSGHPDHELAMAAQEGQYRERGQRVRKDGSVFLADVTITALHKGSRLIGFGKVTRALSDDEENLGLGLPTQPGSAGHMLPPQ